MVIKKKAKYGPLSAITKAQKWYLGIHMRICMGVHSHTHTGTHTCTHRLLQPRGWGTQPWTVITCDWHAKASWDLGASRSTPNGPGLPEVSQRAMGHSVFLEKQQLLS